MNKYLFIIPAIMLSLAFLSLPYVYYQILRFVVFGCFFYIAYQEYKKVKWDYSSISSIVVLVIYNPISPLHLDKNIWIFVNMITVAFIIHLYIYIKQ